MCERLNATAEGVEKAAVVASKKTDQIVKKQARCINPSGCSVYVYVSAKAGEATNRDTNKAICANNDHIPELS